MDSVYDEGALIEHEVRNGRHREVVGGLWDEIGQLQLDFLRRQGLERHHRVLDIGCGSLRGGVPLVRFLDPARYYGIDSNAALLEAGHTIEIDGAGLRDRLPRDHLATTADFKVPWPDVAFDVMIAQSVFTHLSWNRIRACLEKMEASAKDGAMFFATFFEVPPGSPSSEPIDRPDGIVTHGHRDPFHYRADDLRYAAAGLPWEPILIGHWDHPRAQQMMAFRRHARRSAQPDATRRLSPDQATALPARADHYRAFVGSPDRFDFMSATQFSLLFACGLRETHRVLDFGCGSLRLSRLLLPFLREGCYFGIEPNHWLIEDAVERETGPDIVRLKRPRFSPSDAFDCRVFATDFDFIVAQSILTHTGPDLLAAFLLSAKAALKPKGLLLFSVIRGGSEIDCVPADGWHYPHCVAYGEADLVARSAAAGLAATSIPWFHPGAVWFAAAARPDQLPTDQEKRLLAGAVLRDPRYQASVRLPD